MKASSFQSVLSSLVNLRTLSHADSTWAAIADGRFVQLAPSWFIPESVFATLTWYQRRWLTAYAIGKNARTAVLASRSATRMWGMWVVPLTHETTEVIVPHGKIPAHRNRTPDVTYRFSVLGPEDIELRHGVRLTLRLRTALDIARLHGFVEGLVACDWLLAQGFTQDQLTREIRRIGRRKGIAIARSCVKEASAWSESPYESVARALLIEAKVPEVKLQVPIDGKRVDFLIADVVVVEIDGDVKYDGTTFNVPTEAVLIAERKREKALTNLGFAVLRYSPADLHRAPQKLIDDVMRELSARRPDLPPHSSN